MRIKTKPRSKLYTSFTAMEDFWKCPRLYYWRRVRKLELVVFHLPFFIGRLMGPAIHALYEFPKKAESLYDKYYKAELQKIRKATALSSSNEEDLTIAKYVGKGMMVAYRNRYKKLLSATKIIRNEAPFHFEGIEGVVIVGKLDNIMNIRSKNYVHELKTTATLTPDYVSGIQTRMQPAMYKYCVNRIKDTVRAIGGKIAGAIFDVIKKPGIRQKKTESRKKFILRLAEWYDDASDNKFHMERSHQLVLTEDAVMNTLQGTTKQMRMFGMDKEAYYQNFTHCSPSKGFRCDMYALCHEEGGENNKAIMIQYKKREPYQVEKK